MNDSGTKHPQVAADRRIGCLPLIDDTLVTVIVTHHNYSHLVGNALHSLARQTHAAFECVIVDDESSPTHVQALEQVIATLNDKRFRLLKLPRNLGQTGALFAALAESAGEFVALLDPDDLYEPEFLARMLRAHLNPRLYAAVAACNMGLFRVGGSRLTGTYARFKHEAAIDGSLPRAEACLLDFGYSAYYPPETTGWLWCTTSSLMFRRDALSCLRRDSYIPGLKICADTYCVLGAHMLGGTLFVDEVLSWRGIHEGNAVESSMLFSIEQLRHKPEFVDTSRDIRVFVAETLLNNGSFRLLPFATQAAVLKAHFSKAELKSMLTGKQDLIELFAAVRAP